VTVAFFEGRPAFRQLLRQATASTAIVGPTLGAYAGSADGDFVTAMNLIADVVSEGQQEGELRDGDPHAIAHLYSVLINEYVLLNTETEMSGGTLTSEQFHSLIDGALRRPTTADQCGSALQASKVSVDYSGCVCQSARIAEGLR
jgi:hypothetical protein